MGIIFGTYNSRRIWQSLGIRFEVPNLLTPVVYLWAGLYLGTLKGSKGTGLVFRVS